MLQNIESIANIITGFGILVLTSLMVLYAKKAFFNEKKQPAKLSARVNYRFLNERNGKVPVTIDLFNSGDVSCWEVKIQMHFKNNRCIDDCIDFIAPKGTFSYYIGYLTYGREFKESCIELITGTQIKLTQINQSSNYSIEINNNDVKIVCNG